LADVAFCCVLLRFVVFCCAEGCVQRNIGTVVDMLLYLAEGEGACRMLRFVAFCYAQRNIGTNPMLRFVALCCAEDCVQRNVGTVVDMLLYLAYGACRMLRFVAFGYVQRSIGANDVAFCCVMLR